jgi:hypothetical protein
MLPLAFPPRSALQVMARKPAGSDADGMTLTATSQPSEPETAMQSLNSSQFNWGDAKPAQGVPPQARTPGARKPDCGWYDSSLDLAQGLDIVEQDNDALYQLWELARS